MTQEVLSIGALADAAGLSRRAVRFYVQRGLLPPPEGGGRGAHYTALHLERLRAIQELQRHGLALEEIRGRLAVDPGAAPGAGFDLPEPPRRTAQAPSPTAWLRAALGPGVELHFDPTRAALGAADLRALAELVAERLGPHKQHDTHSDL